MDKLENDILEALQEIDNQQGPRHIIFHIGIRKENIAGMNEEIKALKQSIDGFKENILKHLPDKDLIRGFRRCILRDKGEIDKLAQEIKGLEEEIKHFEDLKAAYLTDAKRGLWYDQDSGELINEDPCKEPPENAYIPLEIKS